MKRPSSGILYCDGDQEALFALPRFLGMSAEVRVVLTLSEARAAARERCPDLLVIDPALSDGDGTELIADIRTRHPWVQVFVVCSPDSAGDMSTFIAAGANDVAIKPFDVGTLAHRATRLLSAAAAAHREMSYRQQLETRLSHAERIATLGTLCATVAHEVNNPLAAIVANAGFLVNELRASTPLDDARRRELAEASEDVVVAGNTIRVFVDRIRSFSRRGEEASVDAELAQVVDTVFLLMKPRALSAGVKIVRPTGDAVRSRHFPVRLTQALLNVVANAIDATGRGGKVTMRWIAGEEEVGLAVDDEGPGLAEEVRKHMFEPFFTTKPTGTGLGLIVIQEVMRDHGGRFQLGPREDARGTEARLTLPRANASRDAV